MIENYKEFEDYFDVNYSAEEYPTLKIQRQKWSEERPLEGLKILDAAPLCRNSIYKYMNLVHGGAKLTIGRNQLSSTSEELLEILERSGIATIFSDSEPREFDIIMDCAAQFINFPARIGHVELTRSGTELYQQSGKRVFMADGGKIKMIETCIGTGESYLRAMDHLGYTDWSGKTLALFGCGKVGQGILKAATERGIEVIVISDPEAMREEDRQRAKQVVDFHNREEVMRSVLSCYAMVTSIGQIGAVERTVDVEALIASPLLLANMGAEDEYGASFPAERVLAQKDSLNFILDEPTELKYIDATLTLHNYGAEYLLRNPSAEGVILPPQEVEQELLDQSMKHGVISAKLCELLGSER